jgi:hypothetical protein
MLPNIGLTVFKNAKWGTNEFSRKAAAQNTQQNECSSRNPENAVEVLPINIAIKNSQKKPIELANCTRPLSGG